MFDFFGQTVSREWAHTRLPMAKGALHSSQKKCVGHKYLET